MTAVQLAFYRLFYCKHSLCICVINVKLSRYRHVTVPQGLRSFETPRISRQSVPEGSNVNLTPRSALRPGTYICQRLSRPQGHSATEWIMLMKNSNEAIGNWIRDLPACSAAPQPASCIRVVLFVSCLVFKVSYPEPKKQMFDKEFGTPRLIYIDCTLTLT